MTGDFGVSEASQFLRQDDVPDLANRLFDHIRDLANRVAALEASHATREWKPLAEWTETELRAFVRRHFEARRDLDL